MKKIVLLSSISNQLSFIYFVDFHKLSLSDFEIFVLPPANSRYESEKVHARLMPYARCVSSYFLKFFLFIYVKTLFAFSLNSILYVSRPCWEDGLIGSRIWILISNFFSIFRPFSSSQDIYLRNRVFFGDGFSLCCDNIKPFWLCRQNEALPKINFVNCKSYYLFDPFGKDNIIGLHKSLMSFDDSVLDSLLDNRTDQKLSSLHLHSVCSGSFFLFCGTTFSKSRRMSEISEADMYVEYIKKNFSKTTMIVFKAHPNGLDSVNARVIANLSGLGYRVFYNKEFNSVPLEMFLLWLSRRELESQCTICCVTTGTALALTMFPRIDFLLGFGHDLLSKYLSGQYLESRIRQEVLISKLVDMRRKS